jgi:exopolysaccharide biosynthesis polyprenyl glycosylphosphotransferase
MKQNFSFLYKVALVAGDAFALILGFTLAYILRVSLDPRPVPTPVDSTTFISLIIILLPLWLGIFYVLGLYNKRIYSARPKEVSRLFIGALSGVMLLVTFDFFTNDVLFPARLVPIYAVLMSFVALWLIRTISRWVRLALHRRGYGVVRVLLVGNSDATYYLAKYLHDNPQSGYKVVGVVANKKYVFKELTDRKYGSVAKAIKETAPHAIIQTDGTELTSVYNLSIENHLDYQFIPSHEALFTAKHSIELLGAFPLINVYTTPLIGWGQAVKRAMDIVLSALGLVLTLPIWLVIVVIIKISDPKSKVIYKQARLSRFKKTVNIYKFRTHSRKYHTLSPEEAFNKMGKPELAKEYRENGDYLLNDPRVTRFGRFLRKFSMDELPQMINILKGDISLVGPRALVHQELENYEFKSLILSVKSGLTGLAQISGRKDISFEERRKLDMYYVQNWSILMDIQIILRTFYMVITARGHNE